MVADTLARLVPDGRSRRIAFVALVALMVTLAGCGGAGPSNNTAGTDGGLDDTETEDGVGIGNDTETEDGVGIGNDTETEDGVGVGNDTETEDGVGVGNDTETNETGTANLRVAHMAAGVDAVDVYVDGEEFLTDVSFGDVSDYSEVAPGDYNVSVMAAGENTTLLQQDVTVEEGNYSAVAIPAGETVSGVGEEADDNATETDNATDAGADNASAAAEVLLLEDGTSDDLLDEGTENDTETTDVAANDTGAETTENASIRVVHASPDAGPVNVVVNDTGTTLVEDASFGAATEYVEVPAGEYTLDVVSQDGEVVSTVDVTVEADTPYTAFAAGYVDVVNEVTPLEMYIAVDVPGAMTTMDDGATTEDGNATETENATETSERLTAAPLFG